MAQTNKNTFVPYSIRKKQQNLRSWYEFYTHLSNGGISNQNSAKKVEKELQDLENMYPTLNETNFYFLNSK